MNPHQRAGKDKLSEERRKRLDRIGFTWDPLTEAWDKGFSHLKLYQEREGHCRVPHGHKEGSYSLGRWVSTQRTVNNLSEERRKRLDGIGFTWDPLTEAWDEGFSHLKLYQEREGHCRVPHGHKEGSYSLGRWVSTQRTVNNLSEERRKRLDGIGFTWDPLTEAWEKGFSHLKLHQEREGHCRVPHGHKEGSYSLGRWVSTQRTVNNLSEERHKRLDGIGFTWDPLTEAWEKGFSHLNLYQEREGHCRVPYGHKEGSYSLGTWVGTQRYGKDKLSEERRKRLDDIGFTWDPLTEAWDESFSHLKLYLEREGHCRVPAQHKEGSYSLGTWVTVQRSSKARLSEERRKRLDEIGFIWDPFSEDWDEGFRVLKLYQEREGGCRVPAQHKEGSFRLGTWVGTQRYGKDKLSEERRKRLDDIGFIWGTRKP
jgi:hypothetical protein